MGSNNNPIVKEIIEGTLFPDHKAVAVISENLARRLGIVPVALTDSNVLYIASEKPLNVGAAEELRFIANCTLELEIATREDIARAFDIIYCNGTPLGREGRKSQPLEHSISMRNAALKAVLPKRNADESVNAVDSLLKDAIDKRASDIHLELQESGLRVRFRTDGRLYDARVLAKELHPSITARLKILAQADISDSRRPQEGRFFYEHSGSKIDVRASFMPTISGEKTVLRLLDRRNGIISLGALGFDLKSQRQLADIISIPNGIILATGPTGAGKSTTLYALLEKLNKPDKNIITMEDPVEYRISGITQIQVKDGTELTFASVLRNVLRQDPDVIMVGEIRDRETAMMAVRAALTGHLVLATLHTNDAVSAVLRLVDLGVPRALLASSLRAVIAQRLLRRLCEKCKNSVRINACAAKEIGIAEGSTVFEPHGCEECRSTGYKGRIAVSELLIADKNFCKMIAEGRDEDEMKKYAISNGMNTMKEDAVSKIIAGITSAEEMLMTIFE